MSEEPKPTLDNELSKAQVIVSGSEELATNLPKTYDTYRTMRRDPTLGLARFLSIAPIVMANWSVESDDDTTDDQVRFIQDQLFPIRQHLVKSTMEGGIDFGWQGYEKVFEAREGQIVLRKLKPLLHDITTILVDANTGTFAGFKQTGAGSPVTIPVENCLLISFRVEGTQWHGESLMEHARKAYDQWVAVTKVADKYDRKIAGANWIVYYPMGSSPDETGTEVENHVIAKNLIKALEGSGNIVVPRILPKGLNSLEGIKEFNENNIGWKIDLVTDGFPKQYSFVPRLEYLDKQKVRALVMPERTIIEGKFGTKADAGEHADLALVYMEMTHTELTRFVNWYLVNQLLVLNYGEEIRSKIRLVANPLADEQLAFLRNVYLKHLENEAGFMEESKNIDIDALKDRTGVPKSQEIAGNEPGSADDKDGEADVLIEDLLNAPA